VVGQHGVPVVIMHNRYKAEPTISIVSDINAFFDYSLGIAEKAGISRDAIVLDPGHRLRQDPEQSMEAIAKLGNSSISACRSWSAPRASASSIRCRRRSR
jgi:dihydropteroate synthase